MRKKVFLLFFWLGLFFSLAFGQSLRPNFCDLARFNKGERVLILAPHPDDETIGCAGIIQQAMKAGAQVRVVYLTNGDHNQFAFIVYEKRIPFRRAEFISLGEVRRKEAIKAMQLLGLPEDKLIFLGYPDFGTFAIFTKHWKDAPPYKSLLTHISAVPYKENLSYGAPYRGESILADLEKVIKEYQPDKIFVSHAADVNVDHKALYLFLQIALSDLKNDIRSPEVYPYLIHRIGWPLPRHYHPELPLLPPENFSNSPIPWFTYELTPQQIEAKHQAILCYKSQTESSAFYLLSFGRSNELFGDYPEIKPVKEVLLKGKAPDFTGDLSVFTASYDIAEVNNPDDFSLGKTKVSYGLNREALSIRIDNMKLRDNKMSMLFYLFGYSDQTQFSLMPKIRVIVKNKKIKVLDGGRLIKAEEITLESGDGWLVLSVPFKLLGDPDSLLAAVNGYAEFLPVNASAFRKIKINK